MRLSWLPPHSQSWSALNPAEAKLRRRQDAAWLLIGVGFGALVREMVTWIS